MRTAAFQPESSRWGLLTFLVVSSALGHFMTLWLLPARAPERLATTTVEMELYTPPPPPPPPVEEPPKPLEKPKAKPAPVKMAEVKPPPDAPPPPNDTPPPEPAKPVPLVVGISMTSTTAAGGFAVQVGNTTYGKSADTVVDPSQVKPYSAPRYLPPGGADTEPTLLSEEKIPYPEEARRNEIEGHVRLKVRINPAGTVEEVLVLSGPGYGLNEAARDALKRSRFRPATQGGEAVGYTFIYTYTFLLD